MLMMMVMSWTSFTTRIKNDWRFAVTCNGGLYNDDTSRVRFRDEKSVDNAFSLSVESRRVICQRGRVSVLGKIPNWRTSIEKSECRVVLDKIVPKVTFFDVSFCQNNAPL